jgi:hypothetical protein
LTGGRYSRWCSFRATSSGDPSLKGSRSRNRLVTQARKYNVTLEALGKTMGVSKVRVRQIEEGK